LVREVRRVIESGGRRPQSSFAHVFVEKLSVSDVAVVTGIVRNQIEGTENGSRRDK
jgi:hypothetical protein